MLGQNPGQNLEKGISNQCLYQTHFPYLYKLSGIQLSCTSLHHSQTNILTGWFNQTLKNMILKIAHDCAISIINTQEFVTGTVSHSCIVGVLGYFIFFFTGRQSTHIITHNHQIGEFNWNLR